jgi:hypothetical protein
MIMNERIIEIRKQTIDDHDKSLFELPVVVHGSIDKVLDFINKQTGYINKRNPNLLFGVYWYNPTELTTLLPT